MWSVFYCTAMCTVKDGVRRAVAPHHRIHHPRHRRSRRQHPRVCRHIQVTIDNVITHFQFQDLISKMIKNITKT